jgi:hypothetical protein
MIQNIIPPELRGTALALAECFMGAGSQLLVMGYGRFADRHGLPDTFLYCGCGSWLAAFLIAFLLHLTYPKRNRLLVPGKRQSHWAGKRVGYPGAH